MSNFKAGYNDRLDPYHQIDCEEAIHSMLLERLGAVEHGEVLMQIAKDCMAEVLWHFKPEVFNDRPEHYISRRTP